MDFNQQIIDTFRENGGEVNSPVPFGRGLVLVHVPLKDGGVRVRPLAAIRDDGAWHVVGSAGGSPRNPAWVHGLRRADHVTIEVPGSPVESIEVAVTELTGAERDRLWSRFTAQSPAFEKYLETAEGRVFPIFRLTPDH
ncbi:nitroreductase family deazaflavin-dependent oxidoreductase [Microbacterium pseudoresistens]|uniref:Deazaflavin-dependent oxidoreductase (Nitroreductase family) n=1 Tax=Microbacterium pseudoresistens TaxID=640634 RepID=A0A7Y9EUU0_9MICO|nr:nitroreductase/quinone reductase family protein [Microbacterium pseudoresistens]NYD54377.1 deazaflavin-dependent oxidoreductase (nitroreductase family) [Microbacterium pseudoresistens]